MTKRRILWYKINTMMTAIKEKMIESLKSVLPIALIVLLVSVAFTPLSVSTVVLFVIGVFALVVGMGLFNIGADMAMLPIGNKIGARLTASKKIWLIALVSFLLGLIITIAEPDLQILAELVSGEVDPWTLIVAVGIGVGVFLVVAMLRILFRIPLNVLLIISYAAVFVLCIFVPEGFRPVTFDSGGVTTGPMTVPFIMSLGVGVASIRGGKDSANDSFGLIALSSVGPIIAVEIIGIVFQIGTTDIPYASSPITVVDTSRGAFFAFAEGLGEYATDVLIALAPILAFFLLAQLLTRAFSRHQFLKVLAGFAYTFVGLTVFLTGANVGFMPVGTELGMELADFADGALLVPVAMVFGYFVVAAEPAVHVLTKQVRQVSAGAITERSMKYSLGIGVSISLGLAMMRVLTGISVLWILIPGYAIALIMTFFSPKMYTGIAFDSGGVASGAMVSAFVLPMAIGACLTVDPTGMSVYADAFGCVAFVALTPLLTIQTLGIIHNVKVKRARRRLTVVEDGLTEYEVNYATENC